MPREGSHCINLSVIIMIDAVFKNYFPWEFLEECKSIVKGKMPNDDDDELRLWYDWPTKGIKPYFQPGALSGILNISNLRHAASRIWACAEPEFRLCWMKLSSSDNHYSTTPPHLINKSTMTCRFLLKIPMKKILMKKHLTKKHEKVIVIKLMKRIVSLPRKRD